MKRCFFALMFSVLIFSSALTACNYDDNASLRTQSERDQVLNEDLQREPRKFAFQRDNIYNNPGATEERMGRFNPNLVTGDGQWNRGQLADRLADAAVSIDGVSHATVNIVGNNAYVTLDLNDRLSDRQRAIVSRDVLRTLVGIAPEFDIILRPSR